MSKKNFLLDEPELIDFKRSKDEYYFLLTKDEIESLKLENKYLRNTPQGSKGK